MTNRPLYLEKILRNSVRRGIRSVGPMVSNVAYTYLANCRIEIHRRLRILVPLKNSREIVEH
jgi:hypothetical protein